MTIEMENQSSSTAKVMKKIKVDNFTFGSANEIVAQCIVWNNLSDKRSYEDKSVNIPEFASFLREKKYSTRYDIESGFPLICCDLAQYLNEKEGRTEDQEELKLNEAALKHREENPLTNIFSHFSL